MSDAAWWEAAPAILVACAVLLAPGLVVLAPVRMGIVARIALSGMISVVLIGGAGIVFAPTGAAFGLWQPLLMAVAGGVAVFLARRSAPRVPGDGRAWGLAASWAGGTAIIGVVAFASVPSPELVSQTYDNVFHVSAIADILANGNASSLTLRTLIETDRAFAFYPAGWHATVALVAQITGVSVPVAVNAAWIAVCAVIWLPGVAWLTQACLPRIAAGTVALVALPLGAAFGAMPYALLTWGTLYPTFLATALLPVAVAMPVWAWRGWRATRPARRRRLLVWALVGVVASVAAIALAQPRVLASFALILAVPAGGVFVGWCRRGRRAGGAARARVRKVLAIGGVLVALALVATAWYVIFRLGLFTRPLDDRLTGPQAAAVQPLWAGVWQVVSQSWLTGVGASATWPSLLLAAAVIVGAIAAARGHRTRWIVVAYAVVAVLFVLAAGSDDVVTKLMTALWYKDKYRLSSVLPVLGVPLAALGVITLGRMVSHPRARHAVTVGGAWLVATTSGVALTLGGMTAGVAAVFHMPESGAHGEVVSRAQVSFFGRIGQVVPEGQRVLGDPWDGSAWTLAFGDREPVFPHVNGQWDADRQTLAWSLADIQTNPEVCAALKRLDVEYVVYSPHAFGGGDPAGNHFPGSHEAIEAGLFTEVDSEGDTALFRIDECGTSSPQK
ncbi:MULTISPECIES: DUF6541 family protein [Microbacterium]|uniref:DUF6541 family protein n=1 Tax=Microbacterium TaxID=33882 RepID=UPI000D6441C4|nr:MULTISPECIES: DUF6541 family protein [Microbacterium]